MWRKSRETAADDRFCSVGMNEKCCSIQNDLFNCQTVWSELVGRKRLKRVYALWITPSANPPTTSLVANDIGPCFGFGPGDRPHSSCSVSLISRGMARRQGAR